VAKYFRALGDPTRLRILELLGAEGKLSAGELSAGELTAGSAWPSPKTPTTLPAYAGAGSWRPDASIGWCTTASPTSAWPTWWSWPMSCYNAMLTMWPLLPHPGAVTGPHPKTDRRRETDMPAVTDQDPARRPVI
jgi:hypothetical protein